MLTAWALSMGAAVAQVSSPMPLHPESSWVRLQTEIARTAIDGDYDAAISAWTAYTSTIAADDPSRPEALYRLARSRWFTGDIRGAREALDTCLRGTTLRADCIDLRTHIDLEAGSLHALPAHWTFDNSTHGLFHPRASWDRGTLKLTKDLHGHGVLRWTTHVDAVAIDELVVGFDPSFDGPDSLRLILRSLDMPARLNVTLQDDRGYTYLATIPALTIPQGPATTLRINLRDAVPVGSGLPPFDPAHLYRLHIRDVTGIYGGSGNNTLEIDDLLLD